MKEIMDNEKLIKMLEELQNDTWDMPDGGKYIFARLESIIQYVKDNQPIREG